MEKIVGVCDKCLGNVIQFPWGSFTCYCYGDNETKTWQKDIWEKVE